MEGSSDLGPQEPSDGPFRARMRLHQSWYRAAVLGLPHGEGPTRREGRPLGSMLTRDDAARGANFLTAGIFEVARRRMRAGPGVEPFRCLANMLSSQPMCFNLFGPLVEDTDLATALLRTLVADLERVVEVHIEHAPSPRSEYLGDRTAFDVFVGYERTDGTRAFLGVETKLSESFGEMAYESDRYLELTSEPDAPWRPDAHDTLRTARFNQLWRNHLLVDALRRHPAEPYDAGMLAVVHHPGDTDGSRLVTQYRDLLRDPDQSFADWRLDTVLDRWRSAEVETAHREWLSRFAARYLELDGSAEAWDTATAHRPESHGDRSVEEATSGATAAT